MKIGNIIYDSELINHDKLDYINYYDNIFDKNINYSLPTLFVGWITLKNSFIDRKFDILNKEIIKNKEYWEFNFNENKASHVNGIIDFVNLLPKYFFEGGFQYENIDPVFYNLRSIEDLFKYIPEKIDSYYNYMNEGLYFLCGNKIYGLDLRMFNIFKFDIISILKHVDERSVVKNNDIDGQVYQYFYKIIPDYINLRRYIVCLLIK